MKNYYFTFGYGQEHEGYYVKIIAESYSDARETMLMVYGRKWAFQYNEEQFNDFLTDYPNYKSLETILTSSVPVWWYHRELESFLKVPMKDATIETQEQCELIGLHDIDSEEEVREYLKNNQWDI